MGFGRRLVRKTVRKATPRSVRRAMHPVRTVKNAVTPRPVKQLSRAVYTVTNPLGAAENKLIDVMLGGGHRRPSAGRVAGTQWPVTTSSAGYSASGTRAAEAVASTDRLAQLMAVQRERFAPSRRPIIPPPPPVDPAPFRAAEWQRRRGEARFWQRAKRRRIQAEVEQFAQAEAARSFARLQGMYHEQQARADAWWHALNQGQPQVLTAALNAAFADNPASVTVVTAAGSDAVLILHLPGMDVLPAKKAHVTPTGRLSSKAWTKTELNDVYADLLGAHLLATIREAWAIGCSLTQLRIVGVYRAGILFDVDVTRQGGRWDDDTWGGALLRTAPYGLNRTGRARDIAPWIAQGLRPDARDLVSRAVAP